VSAELAGPGASAADIARIRAVYGLDSPFHERLLGWYAALAQGDLGQSVLLRRSVTEAILERLPVTLSLTALALFLAIAVGVATGILAAMRVNTWVDQATMTVALAGLSLPDFWLGLVMIYLFAVQLGWLPTGGIRTIGGAPPGGAALDALRHLVLPSIALGAGYAAMFARTLRAGMVEAWHADHVRAAHARGLRRRAIVWRAVARPALAPVLVLLGQHVGTLVGGSVVVETVFAVPGMGRLAFEAVSGRDTLLLAGILLCATCVVLVANLLVDLALARLDPRIGQSDG